MIQVFRKTIVWDLLFLAILTAVSLFLISFYFNAQYLNTGYPDWMVHAFRVKFIKEYGFSSWTHFWSNGISILRSYQFVPHYITLYFSDLLNIEIPRAMVLLTIAQFVILRGFIYLTLRLLKFSPTTAFVCSLLSFDIAQYWGAISDYSFMYATLFFPIGIYFFAKYYEGKYTYLFPYLIGIFVYIHLILGFYCFILYLFALIFSDRKIFSKSTGLQISLFLIGSSLFWIPMVVKAGYSYTNPVFSDISFMRLVLSNYEYYGLSFFIVVCLLIATIVTFIPMTEKYNWTKVVTAFSFFMFVLIIIGLNVQLPKAISQTQFTRGANLIGIAIIYGFAPALELVKKIKLRLIKSTLLFAFSVSLVEGLWFISVYSPQPIENIYDPVNKYATLNSKVSNARLWSSDIGNSSYMSPSTVRMPYSYMGHLESNQIAPRLSNLISYHPYLNNMPKVSVDRINDYMKMSGTEYIFFDESSPFAQALLDPNKSDYPEGDQVITPNAYYRVFHTPWPIKNSVLVDVKYKDSMKHFPFDLQLAKTNDQIELDDYVHRFVDVLYKPENTALQVTYPTQETVQIEVPDKRTSKLIYLNESYDANWKAYFNNRLQKIEPSGPNYMLITLDSLEKGTLVLRHTWPLSFYVSVFLIILIPCEMLLMKSISYMFAKKKPVSS